MQPQARTLKALALTLDKLEAMYHEDSASAGARDPLRVRDRELGAGVPHPLRGKLQILRCYSPLVSTRQYRQYKSGTCAPGQQRYLLQQQLIP